MFNDSNDELDYQNMMEFKKATQIIKHLCIHFAPYHSDIEGNVTSISTGGIKDLEEDFEFLGWSDPHKF